MFRVGLNASTRPIFANLSRQAPQAARQFSSFRPNGVLKALKEQSTFFSRGSFTASVRRYISDGPSIIQQTTRPSWQRTALISGGLACSVFLVEGFLNRETRDGLSLTEQSLLHDTFKYTGGGLVITALLARSLFRSGFAMRVMTTNPWVVLGVGLVGGIGTMMGTLYTKPENTVQKHLFWLAFNACQAATLSPMYFFAPAILSRAALYTCMIVGSLSFVGATAKNDTYLYMGGPLLAGLFVVAGASMAPMILPMGMRALAVSEAISLYGGLAVFSGFVLYDTQKILQHGRMVEAGMMKADPVSESLRLELDMINIFIRLVQIMAFSNNRK